MKRSITFATMLFVTALAYQTDASDSLRTVALSAQNAPGGGLFSTLNAPLLNNLGQTAFYGTAGAAGFWSEGSGALSLIAKAGSAAPGIPGATFSTVSVNGELYHNLNDSGAFVFAATLSVPGSSTISRAIWETTPSGLQLLFHENDTVIQGSNEQLSLRDGIDGLDFNNLGLVSFVGESSSDGRYARANVSSASSRIVARGDVEYGDILVRPMNENSFIAYDAGTSSGAAIFSDVGGTSHQVVATNQTAPGVSGKFFKGFSAPSLNNAGHVLFMGEAEALLGPPVIDGLWTDRSGSVQLIAKVGDAVPGIGGATFQRITQTNISPIPQINHSDRIVFSGLLTGNVSASNDSALFSDASGTFRVVAREGDQVPGAPVGTSFGDLYSCASVVSCGFSINGTGQVAFLEPTTGLFAQDVDGVLHAIARVGGTLEVAPGDIRTITRVGFWGGSGNEDGRPSAFNDLGQIAFWAQFTGGTSGVFVSNVVAVPEPTSTTLLLLGILGCGWRPRR